MGLVVMGLCLLLALSPGAASPVAALPETTTFYGVIVGVADYPGGGGLAFTDDDARETKDALLRYGNWEEANIQLLLDPAATKSGIQAAIAQIGAVADADDVVLFFPGTPTGLVQQGDGFTADLTQRIAPQDMDDNAGCVVMTAADADELSHEFYFLQNGLLSFFVIRGLERYWDRNGDGELSAEELSVYSLVGTRWLGSRPGIGQHPQIHDDYPTGDPSAAQLAVGIAPPSRLRPAVHRDKEWADSQ
jgi:hypothetical protein